MSVKPILVAYPPKELEDLIDNSKPSSVNVYIDLKNVSAGLFVPEIVEEMVENSKSGVLDTDIFQSLLKFCIWWMNVCKSRNIKCRIFINSDIGDSVYHNGIYKGYKNSRKNTKTSLDIYKEDIDKIRNRNTLLSEKVLNLIPDIYFFYMKYLETDFISYYLMTRKFKKANNALHIICSNDKDMLQNLYMKNSIQVFKVRGNKSIINHESALSYYTKINKKSTKTQINSNKALNDISVEYIPAIMACVGDKGDDVPGIDNVGPMRAIKMFSDQSEVKNYIGTIDELNDRISNDGKFLKDNFDPNSCSKMWTKVYEDVDLVTNAYKLISYEMLCRWLENKSDTVRLNYMKYIDNIIRKPKVISSAASLFKSLSSTIPNLNFIEKDFEILFRR